MSLASDTVTPHRAGASLAGPSDYLTLLKPRVMSLVIFTALATMIVAPGSVHPVVAFAALLCIAVGAGASGALNQWRSVLEQYRLPQLLGHARTPESK